MTQEELEAHQRLEALQDRLERALGSASRGIRDLVHEPISRELLADIKTCIGSNDHLGISSGLYVLKGLSIERTSSDLPHDFKMFLIGRIVELLKHPTDSVVFDAIDWYGQLRDCYLDYREQMLEFLASADLGRRERGLRYYATYAKPGEVEPLLRFRHDDYASEVRPNGNWEYDLRNRALGLIETQLGKNFPRILRSEPYEGAQVTWYDWTPFLEWWLKNSPAQAI
jgi:hypothetical protein